MALSVESPLLPVRKRVALWCSDFPFCKILQNDHPPYLPVGIISSDEIGREIKKAAKLVLISGVPNITYYLVVLKVPIIL